MKKILFYLIGLFFFLIVLQACGTTQSAAEKEMLAAALRDGVMNSSFTFEATYAYPTGYRSRYLSPYYDVKVSPDTIRSYLPITGVLTVHQWIREREGLFSPAPIFSTGLCRESARGTGSLRLPYLIWTVLSHSVSIFGRKVPPVSL